MPKYQLISTNTKLDKAPPEVKRARFLTYGLAIAPHLRSGYDVCESAGFCSAVCNLWFAGFTTYDSVRQAMIRRAQLLFERPELFRELLDSDLTKFVAWCAKRRIRPAFRPNIASDLDWRDLADNWPTIRFYDYTKVRSRLDEVKRGQWPENYHLTYSVNERSHHRTVSSYLDSGHNVAQVFDTEYLPSIHRIGKLPDSWTFSGREYAVLDGDRHDYRLPEFDGEGTIIGLRFKGGRKLLPEARNRGFVFSVN